MADKVCECCFHKRASGVVGYHMRLACARSPVRFRCRPVLFAKTIFLFALIPFSIRCEVPRNFQLLATSNFLTVKLTLYRSVTFMSSYYPIWEASNFNLDNLARANGSILAYVIVESRPALFITVAAYAINVDVDCESVNLE